MLKSFLALFAALVLTAPAAAQTTPEAGQAANPGAVHTLTKHGPEILKLLKQSGWVSPHLSKRRWIYMISFRSCPDCIRFETEQFPALQKARIDTRVVMVARRAKSTEPERTGVGELWAKRDWKTYEKWTGMPVAAWTGEGYPSGDNDPKRAALVEKSRVLIDQIKPLLADEGIDLRYPSFVWKDSRGRIRGCACEQPDSYPALRADLGIKD